jgi:hypothetical protein
VFDIQDMEKVFLDVETKLANYALQEWQENVIHDAVYYGYINLDQIDESVEAIKMYETQEQMEKNTNLAQKDIVFALTLASKI